MNKKDLQNKIKSHTVKSKQQYQLNGEFRSSIESIKEKCIMQNRKVSNKSFKKVQNEVETKAFYNKSIKLYFDICSSTGQNSFTHRNRTIILEALVKLRVATQKNMNRLPCADISSKDRKSLKTKFTNTLVEVDKYMMQMTHTRELEYTTIYASLYQLEAQYNFDLQNYIDILTHSKTKHGILYSCLKYLCLF